MVRVSKASLVAGFLSLALSLSRAGISGAAEPPVIPPAPNPTACTAEWHVAAEKVATLSQSFVTTTIFDPVDLWRLLMLGEAQPPNGNYGGSYYGWSGNNWEFDKRLKELGLRRPSQIASQANFTYALTLLDERVKLLGKDHPYIRDWVANQLDAFGANGDERPYLRGQYEVPVQALAADDLRYQLAAAQFYAGALDQARDAFLAISNDPESRYRQVARYMLARLPADAGDGPATLSEIDGVERDPAFADVRIMARQLLGVVSWNGSLDSPEGRRLMLIDAAYLQQPRGDLTQPLGQAYEQALVDLRYFFGPDKSRLSDPTAFAEAIAQTPQIGAIDGKQAMDLLVWLDQMEAARPRATGSWLRYHDLRWQDDADRRETAAVYQHIVTAEGFQKLAWTITFALRATPGVDHAEIVGATRHALAQHMADCTATVAEQAAYGVVRYHDLRLHLMAADTGWLKAHVNAEMLADGISGQLEYVRQNQAARYLMALGHGDLITPLAGKLGDAGLRMMLAQTAPELAQALRWGEQHSQPLQMSAVPLLNVLPVEALQQVAADPALSPKIAAPIARVAWLRAYLLADQSALARLTPALRRTNPQLASWLNAYRATWGSGARRLAILNMLLQTPGMTTHFSELSFWDHDLSSVDKHNPNDGNWWCSMKPDQDIERLGPDFYDANLLSDHDDQSYWQQPITAIRQFDPAILAQLTAARTDYLATQPLLRGINHRELDALAQIPMASTYLGRQVIAWVRQRSWLHDLLHGNEDDEMADALARIVRMTRWGCNRDGSPMVMSSRAYGLLHQLFPDSAAAVATPYWYDAQPPAGQ